MKLETITAISPLDGRYRGVASQLSIYFSEYAFIKYRTLVEIEYFIALSRIPLPQLKGLGSNELSDLRRIYKEFSLEDAHRVKQIEKTTNHDVKAVEYFLKERMEAIGLGEQMEFIHFALTSQDINNTAIPLMLKDAVNQEYLPKLTSLIEQLDAFSVEWAGIPMLARTHGQPASPTRLGREFEVFTERLKEQVRQLKMIPSSAKFGGATGNFNAHHVAYPEIDWVGFANNFVDGLGLKRSQHTTQIEHYDNMAALFDAMKRINTILIDLCRDLWSYISMEYFKQSIKSGEIGSSAMPHKVNPIDFENAEGNLGVANALFEHLASKLPISRLQRDLTDSTVMRNIGVPIGHTMISFKALERGLNKLIVNHEAIDNDLESNWAVVAEGIQTILRRENFPQPYEALKGLTRTNKKITRDDMVAFINSLEVSQSVKEELLGLTPQNYTGII